MLTPPTVIPVILSGGAGTRLWPLSRATCPKQFLPLVTERSMIQETALRCAPFGAPIIVCNQEHRFLIAHQMQAIGLATRDIMLEPEGRNTAPSVAVAALRAVESDPAALILVLPSDHVLHDVAAFHQAVALATEAAAAGALVTFGIQPDHPATGYGYIRAGQPLPGVAGCRTATAFIEKPSLDRAEGLLAEGDCLWNSGIFLFPAGLFIDELARLEPDMLAICRRAVAEATLDLDFLRLAPVFAEARNISVDYAVMEHTTRAAVVPVDLGWSDVGSWAALWSIGDKDVAGNVCTGDVILENSRNSLFHSTQPLIAAVGVENVVVVATEGAVLVASKDHAEHVKTIVEQLKTAGRSEESLNRRVYRPWGNYQTLDVGRRFQVKQITVNPGAKLSMQYHYHRAEHWVVVEGTARITSGDQVSLLHENQSTYIPLGQLHRLENPGKVPLCLIEVQSGSYLGEDDIVRIDDQYGRSG